jgi:hypothetical protein
MTSESCQEQEYRTTRAQMSFRLSAGIPSLASAAPALLSAPHSWVILGHVVSQRLCQPLLSKISPTSQQDMREVAGIVDTHAEATSVTITSTLVSLTQSARDKATMTSWSTVSAYSIAIEGQVAPARTPPGPAVRPSELADLDEARRVALVARGARIRRAHCARATG